MAFPDENIGFRVAVFGPSGAGKSAAASRLAASGIDVLWIEASRDLIERREYDPSHPFDVRSREGAAYFDRSSRSEGADWAAQRLFRIIEGQKNILATGIRGLDNLRALKKNGFFCIFLSSSLESCRPRIVSREGVSADQANEHLLREERVFGFSEMSKECHHTIDTSKASEWEVERALFNACLMATPKLQMRPPPAFCARCAMPRTMTFAFSSGSDVCDTCANYARLYRADSDREFLSNFLEEVGRHGGEKALLGYSGGKDSTAALHYLLEAGCKIETFTVDMGYYPTTSLNRAAEWARKFGIIHSEIDGRQFINEDLRRSYELTATFYDKIECEIGLQEALHEYNCSRKRYSVGDCGPAIFPRVCVLCRKSVIRAYYEIATQRGAKYVVLGINEWATLSSGQGATNPKYFGFRKLTPPGAETSVYIVHLPFLIGSSLSANSAILHAMGWHPPFGECLVETNGNSCLLAKSAELNFYKRLGFHPDSTRLSREVTVGFLQRGEALHALSGAADSPWSVRQTLEYAEILGR